MGECNIYQLKKHSCCSGSEANTAILSHDAEEDPELRPVGARPAHHSERWSRGSRQPQHRTGTYKILLLDEV